MDMDSQNSWEERKTQEEILEGYLLPRWYLAYGVWTWPLVVVLLIVVALSPAGERAGFVISWGLLTVIFMVLGNIAVRHWPIS